MIKSNLKTPVFTSVMFVLFYSLPTFASEESHEEKECDTECIPVNGTKPIFDYGNQNTDYGGASTHNNGSYNPAGYTGTNPPNDPEPVDEELSAKEQCIVDATATKGSCLTANVAIAAVETSLCTAGAIAISGGTSGTLTLAGIGFFSICEGAAFTHKASMDADCETDFATDTAHCPN